MSAGAGRATKSVMFLSSYAPLFTLLTIRFDDLALRLGCGSVALVGFLSVWLLVRRQRAVNPVDYPLVSVTPAGGEASAYLAGYLLPFVTVAQPGWQDLSAYALFLVVAALVHFKTGIIQVNPTMFLLGWRIFAVKDAGGFQGYLLSKRRVTPGETVPATRIAEDVIVDHRRVK